MSQIDKEIGLKYIAAWRNAGRIMEALRAKELPLTDTTKGLLSLLPAFEACVRGNKPSQTSGLLQQQSIFARMRL